MLILYNYCIFILAVGLFMIKASTFNVIDDSILHKINWAGNFPKLTEDEPFNSELTTVSMKTARNEEYTCLLPKIQNPSKEENNAYTGLTPFELISPLFSQFVCTFKLESFWTYELCHGRYIRQYHEERDGKKVKLQEYYLGRWDKDQLNVIREKLEAELASPDYKLRLPVKKIEGVNKPALQLNMSDGTICDLNGQPRNTRVLYVCDPRGKHELHSLEEVSTCEYEIVVLSPFLCQHPDFKPREVDEHLISCYSSENSPQVPKALSELENESFKMKHENLLQNLESLLESKLKGEGKSSIFSQEEDSLSKTKITMNPVPSGIPVYDNGFLALFLDGKECLTGGSHWWKYEFCYGKHVLQYHEEQPGGSRTTIMLGKWDLEKHKTWLDLNPHKKPSLTSLKRTVYHYYTGGDQCDATGQPRSVEVKLRCADHPNPSSVSLYLLEPKTCEYSLTVESGLFCTLLLTATHDYGILDVSEYVQQYKPKTSSIRLKQKFKSTSIKTTEDDGSSSGTNDEKTDYNSVNGRNL